MRLIFLNFGKHFLTENFLILDKHFRESQLDLPSKLVLNLII